MSTDFIVADSGSIVLLRPVSPAAKGWAEENISQTTHPWGHSIVIERRYWPAIYEGLVADGLTVA